MPSDVRRPSDLRRSLLRVFFRCDAIRCESAYPNTLATDENDVLVGEL